MFDALACSRIREPACSSVLPMDDEPELAPLISHSGGQCCLAVEGDPCTV